MEETKRKFKEYQKKMHAYSHALNMLYYDAVTSMPKGGSAALGETIGILSEEEYKIESCDEYKGILKELYEKRDELDFITKREAEELFEQQEKITKIPMDEYVQYHVTLNTAESVWHEAKAKNDYQMFMPYLKQIID
jgi:carboxypeptidase Taq